MAFQSLIGQQKLVLPNEVVFRYNGASAINDTVIMDAGNESVMIVGRLELAGGPGTKTMAASGGNSKIHWTTGVSTTLNAASILRVGIQTVDTAAGPPGRGDGTFDVYTAVAGTLASSALQTSVMNAGSDQSMTHGDLICIAYEITTFTAADSVKLRTTSFTTALPNITLRTSGPTFTNQANLLPNAVLEFSDGTFGWISDTFNFVTTVAVSYNSGTATRDEYGIVFRLPFPARVSGISLGAIAATGDFDAILYSDPFGTPVAQRTVSIDANTLSTNAGGTARGVTVPFTTTYDLLANTDYVVSVRPTTGTSLSWTYYDVGAAALMAGHPLGSDSYAVARLDNTGVFADFNGGTAKTRRFPGGVTVSALSDGVGGGSRSYTFG